MNKLIIAICLIIVSGCVDEKQIENNPDIFQFGIHTLEHDSCEYVVFKDNGRSSVSLIHKQNCKFCAKKNKL